MSFKLSELLNPVPGSKPTSSAPQTEDSSSIPPRPPTPPQISHSRDGSATHDSASPLAGNGAQSDSNGAAFKAAESTQAAQGSFRDPNTYHSRSSPISNYGPVAMPVEPSPPLERPEQSFSPTLAQYHHVPHSTNHQRRQSLNQRQSPPPKLAPIQSLPQMSTEQEEVMPRRGDQTLTDSSSHSEKAQESGTTIEGTESAKAGDAPVTSQIRQASPVHLPTLLLAETLPSSPPANVKLEASPTPRDSTPETQIPIASADKSSMRATSATPTTDLPTPKTVVALKEEGRSIKAPSSEGSTPTRDSPSVNATKSTSRKRPAPKSTAGNKKGIASATKKPVAKKRKIDADSYDGTPSSNRSATPASSRASRTPAASGRNKSNTPALTSPVENAEGDDDMDVDEGAELFCICRKPDNHTWMIGCDGGCEDWFHGKCVDIKEEDAALIDKYICPNCEKESKGNTTWLPMCRLEGCRNPARLSMKDLSKYCCDDHGREFMRSHAPKSTTARNKKRKQPHPENGGKDDEMEDRKDGVLGERHLAALARDVKDVGDFRKLGESVPSPPPIASPEGKAEVRMQEDASPEDIQEGSSMLDVGEVERIQQIKDRREELSTRLDSLQDREKFVGLVKERAKKIHDELGGGKKLICGFDSRLSWADEEFDEWRTSSAGQAALVDNKLEPPESLKDSDKEDDKEREEARIGGGVCIKKHCERHKNWQKIQMEDLRFEESQVKEEVKKLLAEENSLKERAKLRLAGKGLEEREGRTEAM